MAFTVPNEADTFNALQAALDSRDLDIMSRGRMGDGVFWGGDVTAQGTPNMSVNVAAGTGRVQGYCVPWNTRSIAITTANGSLHRTDLVVFNSLGSLSVIAGTPGSAAAMPALPSSNTALASVFVTAATTAISASCIIDKRFMQDDAFFWREDEFMNKLGIAVTSGGVGGLDWTLTAGGTDASALQNGEANHPGVFRLQTGTSSGNTSRMHIGITATSLILPITNIARFRVTLRIPTITTLAVKAGFGADISVTSADVYGTEGAWFHADTRNSTNWKVSVRNAGTTTSNSSSVVFNANSWYQLDGFRRSDGNWAFMINATAVGSLSMGSNNPTSVDNFGIHVYTGTGAARNVDIDFVGIDLRTDVATRW